MKKILAALVAVFAVGLATGADAPKTEPAKPADVAPLPGGANSAALKTMLEGLGYDITSEVDLGGGVKGCFVKLTAGKFDVMTRVATSPDRKVVWLQCTMGADGLDKASPEIALKLLDKNTTMSPALIQRSGGRLYLSNFRTNTAFTAKTLKALLDSTSGNIVETEELWNPAKWPKAVAGEDKVNK